jgi:hypothetical protein
VIRPGTRALHVFQGGIKVQETMFPGEDHKGEQPLVSSHTMGRRPIPCQGMDPLDLLCGPRLDAVGIQSRAKESFKEYYSLNLSNLAGN